MAGEHFYEKTGALSGAAAGSGANSTYSVLGPNALSS